MTAYRGSLPRNPLVRCIALKRVPGGSEYGLEALCRDPGRKGERMIGSLQEALEQPREHGRLRVCPRCALVAALALVQGDVVGAETREVDDFESLGAYLGALAENNGEPLTDAQLDAWRTEEAALELSRPIILHWNGHRFASRTGHRMPWQDRLPKRGVELMVALERAAKAAFYHFDRRPVTVTYRGSWCQFNGQTVTSWTG